MTIPAKIYLQWFADDDCGKGMDCDCEVWADDVTWWVKKENDSDVAYIRLDLHEATIAEKDARIAELETALRECADDLEAGIKADYPGDSLTYPTMERRYNQDMETVNTARRLLSPTA